MGVYGIGPPTFAQWADQVQVLARTLFDRITLQDAQTNHTRDYFIVAEEHEVDLGSSRHRVQWLVEPADSDIFFIIGTHKPDGTRALAF